MVRQALKVAQATSFSNVVEAIKSLSIEEKQAIQLLLKQYLREERRAEIYENFKAAQAEQHSRDLKFSSNIAELKQLHAGVMAEVSFSSSTIY